LVACLILTAVAWYLSAAAARSGAHVQFEAATDRIATIARQQLLADETIVRASAALLSSSGAPSHEEWRRYVKELDLKERVPALRSLGFTLQVSPDPDLRAAMHRARDSGASTLAFPNLRPPTSAKSRRDPQAEPHPEAMLYVPVYETAVIPAGVARRRATLRGYLFAVLDQDELIRGVLGSGPGNITCRLAISPHQPAAAAPAFTASRELGAPAHGGILACESDHALAGQSALPQLVLATGIPVSLLLFVGAFAVTTTRQRAQSLADQITANLRREAQERRREEINLRQIQRLDALATLSRGIAHELGDSVEEILEHGDVLRNAVPPESLLRRPIESIVGAGLRARSALERIVAFSRGGVGERIPIHAQSLLTQILEEVRDSLPAGVRLGQELHAGDAAIVGDPTQIQQIVTSLCSNALDAMRAGGVLSVYLDLVSLEDSRTYATATALPGDYVRLRVRDSGVGIAPERLERIFDPYFTSQDTGFALGLGLTLVQSIANDLGGAVDVQSEPGRGTTLTVLLPRHGNMPAAHSTGMSGSQTRLNRDPNPGARATPMR
jgi:signal transduction histidine kinase